MPSVKCMLIAPYADHDSEGQWSIIAIMIKTVIVQSFWAHSRAKLGYSGKSPPPHLVLMIWQAQGACRSFSMMRDRTRIMVIRSPALELVASETSCREASMGLMIMAHHWPASQSAYVSLDMLEELQSRSRCSCKCSTQQPVGSSTAIS